MADEIDPQAVNQTWVPNRVEEMRMTRRQQKRSIKDTECAPEETGRTLRYVGHRPFQWDAGDESGPVLPGELVGPGHQYESIIDHLAHRADFVEVDNG